jgi:SAM-dependent methyltransferase
MREDDSSRVGRYYDEVNFDSEISRLDEMFPIEFAITARVIERFIPALLAARGCTLQLVDVSRKLLEFVHARIPEARAHHASATDLPIAEATCDAVLMMGPLYHLTALEDRRRAVAEAARVLKPGGTLIAAGINRLTFLRDSFREIPEEAVWLREAHARFVREGTVDPSLAAPLGYAHLTTLAEFRELFEKAFVEISTLAVESFAGPWQAKFKALSEDARKAWLDVIEQTAAMPEALGMSDHILFIGRRSAADCPLTGSQQNPSRML